MCDPVSIGYAIAGTAVAASAADSSRKARHGAMDAANQAAADRAEAEAKAAQTANFKLAQDNRRRREQKSLLATGAPQPTFGDEAATTDGGGFLTSIRTVASRSSLLSRGAAGGSLSTPYQTRTEGIGRPGRQL